MIEAEEKKQERIELAWKIFLWSMALLISIQLGISKSLWETGIKNDRRLTIIESSSCTFADCGNIRASVFDLRADIATFPKQIPPQWVIDRLAGFERRIERLEEKYTERISKKSKL